MGYLSCRADSSLSTCRSISSFSPTHSNRNKPNSDEPNNNNNNTHILNFSYNELQTATQNFANALLLGRGSHGTVYRATLPSGRSVAVKRPSHRPAPSPASVDNEIDILSHIQNPRLVNLIGFTPPNSKNERLLVVELMPNGTLFDLLHSNPRPPGWSRRLRLSFQTAKALLSLHSARPPIIHRDVKSANVLLDERFDARLADFGLALFNSSVRVRSTPPPAGTLGYLDPGYVTPENLSTKTDVFSFGILLLEIISGRKAIDVCYSPPSIVEWAVPLVKKGKILGIFDPRIDPPRDALARRQLALLAASCVRSCRDRRPGMEEIVEQLRALSRTVPGRVWAVSTPCSVVDTERGIVKIGGLKEREEIGVGGKKKDSCASSASPANRSFPPFRIVRPGNGRVSVGVDRNNESVDGRARRLIVAPAAADL